MSLWFTRGLFEKDKLVFSFMLCVEVMKLNNDILPQDWNYFIRGATGANVEFPPKPDVSWLQPWQWHDACRLDAVLPAFKGFKSAIVSTPCWVKFGDNVVVSISDTNLVCHLNSSTELKQRLSITSDSVNREATSCSNMSLSMSIKNF